MHVRDDPGSLAKCCLRVKAGNSPGSNYNSILPSGNSVKLEYPVYEEVERTEEA